MKLPSPQTICWLLLQTCCLALLPLIVCENGFAASVDEKTPASSQRMNGAIPIANFSFEREEDRDFDRQPDDWIRRKGTAFRGYVNAEIDYARANSGSRSLRIDANGSSAAYYSPPLPVDAEHSYLMSASIRTQGLRHSAAIVSFSFLNHRKQRIHRVLSSPVSGSHGEWQSLRLDPIMPAESVCFVVIGCHLVPSSQNDISGSAWFDEIRIGKLPRLNLASNFETHFRQARAEITIESYATGLDEKHADQQFDYELRLQSEDVYGTIIDRTSTKIEGQLSGQTDEKRGRTLWELPVYPPGYYRVRAMLLRNGEEIVSRYTSFAVLNLRGASPTSGEFGWNLSGAPHRIGPEDMLAITRESGINWVKTPVWSDGSPQLASERGHLLTGLRNQSIVPIGMLVDPPSDIRAKFAEDWTGISELFTAPPIVWREAANQVMATYSPTVTRWQLGDDRDSSFVGMPNFIATVETIRKELQRIGQIRQLGVRWNVDSAVPSNTAISRNFLTLTFDEDQSFEAMTNNVRDIQDKGYEAWVVVKADRRTEDSDPNDRANNLVRRMIDAKRTGADVIFAHEVFDPEYGLLNPDGSPTDLFLPWRTVSLALNHSQYVGSFQMPNRSTNHVFLRKDDAAIVVWNDEPVEEEIYLGDDVVRNDVWGDQIRMHGSPQHGRQTIKVTSVPTILTGCSLELARWRMNASFDKGQIASSSAEHEDTLKLTNTFPWNVQGTMSVISSYGWDIQPQKVTVGAGREEQIEIPLTIKLPSQAAIGEQMLAFEFDLGGSGLSFPFRVYRDYQVGTGDVHMDIQLTRLPDGGVMVEQIVTNETSPAEVIDFRCNLLIRGRRRLTRNMTGLVSGQSRKTRYLIPDFDTLQSKDLWLRAEQKNGNRSLNEILKEDQVIRILENAITDQAPEAETTEPASETGTAEN
ncbi:hypothetical protein [Rubinisphaera margarita]|uniref:hypothetical protein n=1 Tax=Rubinisphaera margarita TaxID=2909586 RepID=UPI001EE78D4A|nr:hypothetical protein [Rubinisphaera margarita]MCG6157361.1 hypothetical protein [Rubinisphaera margarita]